MKITTDNNGWHNVTINRKHSEKVTMYIRELNEKGEPIIKIINHENNNDKNNPRN